MKNNKNNNGWIEVIILLLLIFGGATGLLSIVGVNCSISPQYGGSNLPYWNTQTFCTYPNLPTLPNTITQGIFLYGATGANANSSIIIYSVYNNQIQALCNCNPGTIRNPITGSGINSPNGAILIFYPQNVLNTTQSGYAYTLNQQYLYRPGISGLQWNLTGYANIINSTNAYIKNNACATGTLNVNITISNAYLFFNSAKCTAGSSPPPPPPSIPWYITVLNNIQTWIQSIIKQYFCIKGVTC